VDILDDMGVSKLSAKVFKKINYSFNVTHVSNSNFCVKVFHCASDTFLILLKLKAVFLGWMKSFLLQFRGTTGVENHMTYSLTLSRSLEYIC